MKDEGQTLITFSHHTNYDGTMNGESTKDSVNLQNAIRDQNTCADKLNDLRLMGIPIGWSNNWTGKTYRSALVSSVFSNLSYVVFNASPHRLLLGAIIGDVIPQTLIMPEIHGCVDTEEGYYTHIFVSKEAAKQIESDPKNKIGDAIIKGADNTQKMLTGATKGNTKLQDAAKQTTAEIKNFAQKTLVDNPIAQSRFETTGNTTATVNGKLYFFELGKGSSCRASGYNDKGNEFLTDNKSKDTIEINKDKGEMNIKDENGTIRNIISTKNKDWVRLIATNLGIPAKVIPHNLSYIPVPDNNAPLFTIDVYGNLTIDNPAVLDCLKNNYNAQTGLTMSGNSLTDYLGTVKTVISTNQLSPNTQYNIIPKGSQGLNEIIAEGTPREIANGESSTITINGNRTTALYPIQNKKMFLGKNISIQFERGQLIYNGEKNSYIMWVEQTSKVNQTDISDMQTNIKKYNNKVTGCEEVALDFTVKPVANNADATAKTDKMNKALQKVGPFQMFDTPTKTFIFYTGGPPKCEKRMKIIDKKTGKIITDQAISDITQTPDGMIVKTADGKEHKFAFSAKDGVPKLKYNDETQTLLSAQGKNGSFWYDPNTGNWYTENGHLIPFNPEYKDGMMYQAGADGKVTGSPAQNPMNINIGNGTNGKSSFNIPLTPEKVIPMILYLLAIVSAIFMIFERRKRKN